MDYERLERPQVGGGGFSPGKLRSILLGTDRKRKDNELESISTLRSELTDTDDSAVGSSDNCIDVDVVSELREDVPSTVISTLNAQMVGDHRLKDQYFFNSRARPQDGSPLDDNTSVAPSLFEFQKAERAPQRMSLGPFSKPAPSKWDDAQKWIASPTTNHMKPGQGHAGLRKAPTFGYGSRQSSMKLVDVSDQKLIAFEEPCKKQDPSLAKKDGGLQKVAGWEADSHIKPVLMVESSVTESARSSTQHNKSSAMTFIQLPSTAASVSMRDMGTEMTPIASQEPSRNGTPVRATTPIRSPVSSRPASPGKIPADVKADPAQELSEKELQMKTRREIMMLGTQLGKMNIAAWASKEEEDKDASFSLKTVASEQPQSAAEARAAAWEEAEKAKYLARYKREEMKIQAWENHQNAKTEAELRRIEVEVERIRGQAQERLMNKLAAARHKAEEKRAVAEARRDRRAARAEKQAEQIRKTGRIPSSCSCWSWCS